MINPLTALAPLHSTVSALIEPFVFERIRLGALRDDETLGNLAPWVQELIARRGELTHTK